MFNAFRVGGCAAAFLFLSTLLAVPAAASVTPVAPPPVAFTQAAPAISPSPAPVPAARPAAATSARSLSLRDLVIAFVNYGNQDAEQECLAGAVYFEARSEPLEGQLAVAQVVLNRAASGRYPPKICDVVTQPAQFSFIRGGKFPPIDKSSDAWHKALAIADIARKNLVQKIASNVLWYHANYVAPSWGRRLTRAVQLGTHIFYN
ncbi:cell wall hydrolase [Sphingomonas cavernae]|uniref:Cell wall hydrolase n=1 Tax=Sphingomonas cavernae TaxID=2320861 RepID=A0A418WL16_9SPHN|nr:cell wall hydrolase [Sphingomonas cavernae]RJF90727.1 cell wall hydrolase [Sphingomonas cavernae]